MAVVLFHVNESLKRICHADRTPFRVFDSKFALAAWFFFGLSGFLMAYLSDTGCDRFLLRRLIRIYPSYWLAAGLSIVGKVALFGSAENLGLVAAMSLTPQGGQVQYPLAIEWTLIYEVFFYAVCAPFAWRPLRRAFPFFLAAWGSALVVADLRYGHTTLAIPGARNLPLSLFNGPFILGGLSYHAYKRLPATRLARGVALAVALVALPLSQSGDHSLSFRFAVLGLDFAALFVCGTLGDRVAKATSAPFRALERLGDLSYGIYLVHARFITFVLSYGYGVLGYHHPRRLAYLATALALIGGGLYGRLDLALYHALKRRISPSRRPAAPAPAGPHFAVSPAAVEGRA